MVVIIETVQQHLDHGYKIQCWCPKCRRGVEYTLEKLIEQGLGGKALSDIRVRHACGARVEIRRGWYGQHQPFMVSKYTPGHGSQEQAAEAADPHR